MKYPLRMKEYDVKWAYFSTRHNLLYNTDHYPEKDSHQSGSNANRTLLLLYWGTDFEYLRHSFYINMGEIRTWNHRVIRGQWTIWPLKTKFLFFGVYNKVTLTEIVYNQIGFMTSLQNIDKSFS